MYVGWGEGLGIGGGVGVLVRSCSFLCSKLLIGEGAEEASSGRYVGSPVGRLMGGLHVTCRI